MTRARLRDLGITVGLLPTGPANAITDVPGVRVGHTTLVEGAGPHVPGQGPIRTGVTVIVPHGGNQYTHRVPAAIHVLNGAGEMTWPIAGRGVGHTGHADLPDEHPQRRSGLRRRRRVRAARVPARRPARRFRDSGRRRMQRRGLQRLLRPPRQEGARLRRPGKAPGMARSKRGTSGRALAWSATSIRAASGPRRAG